MSIEAVEAIIDLIEIGAVVGNNNIVKCLRNALNDRDFDDPVIGVDGKPSPNNEPLYTHPQPRKPLTDEQKNSERYLFLRNNANAELAENAWRAAMRNRGAAMDEVIDHAIDAAHGIKE
jgi:hypothetical protein